MRIKEKFKNQNKFIFLFLLVFCFLCNPIEVKAEFTDIDGDAYTEAYSSEFLSTSYNLDKWHTGVDDMMMEYAVENGIDLNNSKLVFYNMRSAGEEIKTKTVFPDCAIFMDQSVSQAGNYYEEKIVTGWLYLYCDSARYSEAIGNKIRHWDNLPRIYAADGKEVFNITVPGTFVYAPISNIVEGNTAIGQLWNKDKSDIEDSEILGEYVYGYNKAIQLAYLKGNHNINNFSALNGAYEVSTRISADGNLVDTIPKDKAWILYLFISANIEAGLDKEGGTNAYGVESSITWGDIEQSIEQTVNDANYNRDFIYDFIDKNAFFGENSIDDDYIFNIFKTETQGLGVDTIYGGDGQKTLYASWGQCMDIYTAFEYIYQKLLEKGESKLLYEADDKTLNKLVFLDILVGGGSYGYTNVPANFVKIENNEGETKEGLIRYLWAAEGNTMMRACCLSARDTTADFNISKYKFELTEIEKYTGHVALEDYPKYGNSLYGSLTPSEKVFSTITILQEYPSLAERMLDEIGSEVDSVLDLNQLGKTDYFAWRNTVTALGNAMYNGLAISDCPSTGWSTIVGFRYKDSDRRWASIEVGMTISFWVPSTVEDLVVSNSYNTSNSFYEADVNYNPTGRNVIDWVHNNISFPSSNIGFSSSGGKSSVTDNRDTTIDTSSSWHYFDINSVALLNGTKKLGLSKNANNVMDLQSNQELALAYERNHEDVEFETYVFVGRAPEGDEGYKINTSDFNLVATMEYNNFNSGDFDASNDINRGARDSIHQDMEEGTAASELGRSFSYFQTTYNMNKFFDLYSNGTISTYNNHWQIKGKIAGKLAFNADTLENYEVEDYLDKGPNAEGYSGLIATSGWNTGFSGGELAPGDVIAYKFNFKIPNDSTLSTELARNSSTSVSTVSLLRSGSWYDDYGTILLMDITYDLVPSTTLEDSKEWFIMNRNMYNDWTRQRIIPPVFKNIFFTKAEVCKDGATIQSYSPGVQTLDDIQYTVGRDSTRETTFVVNAGEFSTSGGADDFSIDTLSLNLNWRFYVKGLSLSDVSASTYNYLDFSNSFTQQASDRASFNNSTKVQGTVTSGSQNADMKTTSKSDPKLTVKLNDADLNANGANTISASVPKNSSNQFINDWEIVNLVVEVPQKNNAAIDLILAKGTTDVGDSSVYRGGSNNSTPQIMETPPTNTTLYGIVRREEPRDKSFDEYPLSGNIAEILYTLNDSFEQQVVFASPVMGPVNGYSGKVLSQFKNSGDILIFKTPIPGEVVKLTAILNYRNKDYLSYDYNDCAIIDNSWYESWMVDMTPDFSIDITQWQEDVVCTTDSVITYKPWAEITVKQENPYCLDAYNPVMIIELGGMGEGFDTGRGPDAVLQTSGDITQNGDKSKYFTAKFTGGYQEYKIKVEFEERKLNEIYKPEIDECQGSCSDWTTTNPKQVYAMINDSSVKTIFKEKNFTNNNDSEYFNEIISCEAKDCSISPCCLEPEAPCENFYGIGQRYEWNVKFRWYQQGDHENDIVNKRDHRAVCVECESWNELIEIIIHEIVDAITGETTIQEEYVYEYHEIITYDCCHCTCENSHPGPNDEVKRWRTELGLGLYYEVFDMKIFVNSTGNGLREVEDNGYTYVYNGESFSFYFIATYESNRDQLPDSPYQPNSQEYENYGPSDGCRGPCNWLYISPKVDNVAGPLKAKIDISGAASIDGTYIYNAPDLFKRNAEVQKEFKFNPIANVDYSGSEVHYNNGQIFVRDNNVNQKIDLSFCIEQFYGHKNDSSRLEGTNVGMNAYAWEQRDKHCYCDTIRATIYIRPSKGILSTDLPLGMDGATDDESSGNIVSTGASISDGTSGSGSGEVDWDEDTWIH